ncbi:hypothetical protein [Asanoa iriomotensis]|uniref:Uncharacterized protein n=1 Tax=Asanoa iriomotensis TaxID=234613 RepID=A0ABQ4C721_9ACTN|nr:hypothetical protein [Asanoa iriomotensis]GIF58241.1 hypothetical protein Air01nite_43360 [Asanoa iriomotensis]
MTYVTGPNPPTEPPRPTMATIFPDATARVAGVLRELGHSDLADSLPAQHFHGRCHCKPGCTFVLTAPPGSSGSLMIWLEVSEETVGEVSVDPDGQTITNLDIGDPTTLGIPPTWLEDGLSSVPERTRPPT